MKNLASISLKRAVWIVLLTAFLSNAKAIDVGAQEGKSNDNSPAGLEDIPEWLRSYPGAKPEVTYSSKSENSIYVSFRFRTNDAVNNVADYYQQKLQAAGLGFEKTIQQGFRGTEIAIHTPILKYPRIRINIGSEDNNQTKAEFGKGASS